MPFHYSIGFRIGLSLLLGVLIYSCQTGDSFKSGPALFSLMDSEKTGIDFVNQVDYTEEYNTYTYRNFYNGAGVGIGDFNNDGWPDLYFCGNIVNNKLYINKGDLIFEDVTEHAGVACNDVWSTGVSIADVNGDGWLDIYVCKSGDPSTKNRTNALFINNGDLTFTEKAAEYGIADLGLSTHASFFDYDRDGDLDCYLLNNSFQSVTEYDITPGERLVRDTLGGNKLYRNEGDHFEDVSEEAGIFGSKIGFGLGASVADVNRDGWMDLYVSNDFFERDYLYINQKNGTFRESLVSQIGEISLGAMGADIGDINNDAFPEIFVTEMTAEGEDRLKTKVLFESWDRYQYKLANGYHHQFARNVLQLNNRNDSFSEIGRLSGVEATDWSWGALIMDLDNDGWKDIFVANGIFKDLLDRDYLDIYSNPAIMRSMIASEEKAILSIIDQIPSERIPNYIFQNNGDLTFTNLADVWGLGTPSHSNGAAYGDLDNDGDLDLVVSNVNMPPFLYKNQTSAKTSSNFLQIFLKGKAANTGAIGASITLYYDGKVNHQEQVPARGFKSCVDHRLHFGIGDAERIDSLVVEWPDGDCTVLKDIKINRILEIEQANVTNSCLGIPKPQPVPVFQKVSPPIGLDFVHRENDFVDFDRDPLLFHMISNEGPRMAVGDVNGDGLDDLYIGGAKDAQGALLLQMRDGRFRTSNSTLFKKDRLSEDTDCAFFDADVDGDLDLYVASGGNEFPASSSALRDRLYLNNGDGEFTRSDQLLPGPRYESSSCVEPCDFDLDGDLDLFVGIRLRPFLYGIPVQGYILENDGTGQFSNATPNIAPGLNEIGMITDMVWSDVDNDGDPDMVLVGDWMPVKLFINEEGEFYDQSDAFGLSGTEGWWNTITAKDLNADGNMDFVLGNHGLNSRFSASADRPVTLYVNDFDMNGSAEQIICTYNGDHSYPMVMKDDLIQRLPGLEKKYKTYAEYAGQSIFEIFTQDLLQKAVRREARLLETCLMINSGEHGFTVVSLPAEAQFSPVYAILAEDFDRDGICDILLGGNQFRAKPETGMYGASFGLLLKGNRQGTWHAIPADSSGIFTRGEIRDLKFLEINGSRIVAVARNNDILEYYKYYSE